MRFTGSAGNARSLDLSQGSPGAYIPSSREDIAFLIGHFRFAPGLCFKAIWKWFFISFNVKLIFTRNVLHLAWFWRWEFLELGEGLFDITFITWTRYYWADSGLIRMSKTGLSTVHRSRVWTCPIALLKPSCSARFWARTKLAPWAVTSINFASKERIFPWVVCHHRYHHISNIITRIIIIIIITNIIHYYHPATF